MTERQVVTDSGAPWKYFHVMLNMEDEELDVYEYRLLGHYRRVCGSKNQPCEETTRETAGKINGMCAAKVSTTRAELARKGWISLETVKGSLVVTLVDKWGENIARYSPANVAAKRSCGEHATMQRSCGEQSVHVINAAFMRRTKRSGREHAHIYINNNKQQDKKPESTTAAVSPNPDPSSPLPVVDAGADVDLIPLVKKLGLIPEAQAELLALESVKALAICWEAQGLGVKQPAALAVSMMRGAGPPEAQIERAREALALGIVDQAEFEKAGRWREAETLNAEADAIWAAQREGNEQAAVATNEPPGESDGLDDKPEGSNLTWRDVWQVAKDDLSCQWQATTFSMLRGSRVLRMRGDVMTVRAGGGILTRDSLMSGKFRPAIEYAVSRAAYPGRKIPPVGDMPVKVEFVMLGEA